MNYNKLPDSEHRWRNIAIFLFCVLVLIGIVYMKQATGEQKSLNSGEAGGAASKAVAVPDTTMEPGLLPVSADTIVPSVLPDTVLGKDKRDPYEAGYEDGYTAGCDDGALDQDSATYDETSGFQSESERQNYTRGYREGYAKGLEDGKQGKQFNI